MSDQPKQETPSVLDQFRAMKAAAVESKSKEPDAPPAVDASKDDPSVVDKDDAKQQDAEPIDDIDMDAWITDKDKDDIPQDAEPDLVDYRKKYEEAMEKIASMSQTPIDQKKPQKPVEPAISDEQFDAIISDKEAFIAYLTQREHKVREESLLKAAEIAQATSVQMMSVEEETREFKKNYQDIFKIGCKTDGDRIERERLIARVVRGVMNEDPSLSRIKALDVAGRQVREMLRGVAYRSRSTTPNSPNRNQSTPVVNPNRSALNDMKNA